MKSIYRGIVLGIFLIAAFSVNSTGVYASGNCPFTATGNQILVDFENPVGRLYSHGPDGKNSNTNNWKSHVDMNLPKTITAGKYKISLAASDEYDTRVNITQTNEQYYVVFKSSNNSTLATSGTSGDVPDRVRKGEWKGSVGTINISGSTSKIRVQHAFLTNNASNSLNPSCMLIEPVFISTVSSCPFTEENGGKVFNFATPGDARQFIVSNQESAGFKRELDLGTSIPKGNYKISIATYDGYPNRSRVVGQNKEQVHLVFKNNSTVLAKSNSSMDLQEGVDHAEWYGIVNQSLYISGDTNHITMMHSAYPDNSISHSVSPNCVYIEPISTSTPEIDNGSCIVSEGNFVRYNRSYPFSASVKNNANQAVYLTKANRTITNQHFLDAGGTFAWTSQIKNANYKVNAGSNIAYLATTGNWRIKDKPNVRTQARQNSYDFMIKYSVDYDGDNSRNNTSNDRTSKKCVYYSVTSCGDGVIDSGYETCDPNDSSKIGWGNGGCSNICEAINIVEPTITCDSLNISTTSIYAPSAISFQCDGTGTDNFLINCGNGSTVNSKTGTCDYTSEGNYEMTCYAVKGNDKVTSNSCKKTVTVKSHNPAIQVLKTAIDGTDLQTVEVGNTAGFTITVTNIGDENLDRNIVLSDPNASLCAGTLILPTNYPSNFKNFKYFGNGNHNNSVLEPGESFHYNCYKANTTKDYTNTISVNGRGTDTRMTVSDTDSTKVQTKTTIIEIPDCPYTQSGDNRVIDFSNTILMSLSKGPFEKTFNIGSIVKSGKYKISLFGADGYASRVNVFQPNERYKVIFQKNGSKVAESGSTGDLPDYRALGTWEGVVNSSLNIGDFNQVKVLHSNYIDNSSPNSIWPVCMLVEPLGVEPNESCPFKPVGDEILVDFSNIGRIYSLEGTGLPSHWKTSGDVSLPVSLPKGDYKISLASDDGYSTRDKSGVQPHERYKVIFKDSSKNHIIETASTVDLQDHVKYAQWSGVVNSKLHISKSSLNLTVMHAYLGGNSPNSLNPVCMLIKPLSTPAEPSIKIDKRDANPNDLDKNVGNDEQTVTKGTKAVFKIRITNDGSEDLKDILLSDTIAPNCGGSVVLPNTYSNDWSKFSIGGAGNHSDNLLQPGEYFDYICEKLNTTDDYTNTADVTAKGANSGKNIDSTDDTKVKVSLELRVPECPFVEEKGGKIFNFPVFTPPYMVSVSTWGNYKHDLDLGFTIKKGNYKISLASYDGYTTRIQTGVQPKEIIKVIFKNNSTKVAESGTTQDLEDGVIQAEWYGVVNDSLYLSKNSNKITVIHGAYVDNSSANSVRPTCVYIEPLDNPTTPSIAIDKRDANASDKDGTVGNDTQTVKLGEKAIFKIRVTNNGTENLKTIKVTDTIAPNCAGSVTLQNTYPSTWSNFKTGGPVNSVGDELEPGEWFEYTCLKLNTTDSYTNVAGVTAKGITSNKSVDDSDSTQVLVSTEGPSIIIDKTDANVLDEDGTVGDDTQTVESGDKAVFKIRVTNNGTEALNTIKLTDAIAPNCSGSVTLPGTKPSTWNSFQIGGSGNNSDALLQPGEWFEYTCLKANTTVNYTNTAGVTAKGATTSKSVNDSDTTKVLVTTEGPSIIIDKKDGNTNDKDGTVGNDTQTVNSGDKAVFTIKVTNNGTENLNTIKLTDAKAPNCAGSVTLPGIKPSTWSNFTLGGTGDKTDAVLEPGEWFEYTCLKANTTASYTNTAGVTAKGVTSKKSVTNSDTTEVLVEGTTPSIKVDKIDNNSDLDTDGTVGNDTQTVKVGDKATFRITVTNDGTEGLTNIKLTDAVEIQCAGDVVLPDSKPDSWLNFTVTGNGDNIFDPGETFSYDCSKLNTTTNYTNTVGVEGTGVDSGTKVTDNDTTLVKIPTGSTCNTLTVDKTSGTKTLSVVATCSGTDVKTFKIDCGNGQVFTGNGNNSGVETLSKTCSYTADGNYNPTCTINGTITNNSCQKQVKVGGGGGGGGSSPSCTRIEIDTTSSTSNTLDTQIECIGNSKVDSIMLKFGDGRYEIVNDISKKHTFNVSYSSNDKVTYRPKCYVSGSKTISDENSSSWKSKLACADKITLGNTSGGGGGGKTTYCGDGVLQRPNSDGQKEQCERVLNDSTGKLGAFPEWCTNTCQTKSNPNVPTTPTITLPGEGSINLYYAGNALVGNNQDAYDGLIPYIENDASSRIYLNKKLCVYNTGNKNIVTGGNGVCSSKIIGLLTPGERVYLNEAVGYFKGKISGITSGTYKDTVLSATLESEGGGLSNAYFAARRNVRVSKPSIATVGGGVSLMKADSTKNKVADVSNLAQGGYANTNNTNFVGASVSDSKALSSSSKETTAKNIVEKVEEDNSSYEESIEVVEEDEVITVVGTVNSLSSSEMESYNGNDDIYILNGKNLSISSIDTTLTKPTTYIINGGDLIIKGNLSSSQAIAFIVKGGDIIIDSNVTDLDGSYVAIPKNGQGGKILASGGDTSNQLLIKGGIYGDKTDLIENRTYVSNDGGTSSQISVGTIIWKGASMFSKTPPMLRSFINEYKEETSVAK